MLTTLILWTLSTPSLAAESAWNTPGRGVAPDGWSVRLSEGIVPSSLETTYGFTSLIGDLPLFAKRDWVRQLALRARVHSTVMWVPTEDRAAFLVGALELEGWMLGEGWSLWGGELRPAAFLGLSLPLDFVNRHHSEALFVHGGETLGMEGFPLGLQATWRRGPWALAAEAHGTATIGSYGYETTTFATLHGFYSPQDRWVFSGGMVLSRWMNHAQAQVRWRPNELIEAGLGVNLPLFPGDRGPDYRFVETPLIEPMLDVTARF